MAARPNPDSLEILLAGISALANRLRKNDRVGRDHQLPPGGKAVLGTLAALGPRTVPQLARLHATSRQNIQMAVNKLTATRCVMPAENPAHRRSRLITLTDAGRARLQSAAQHEAALLAPLVERISEGEIAATHEIIGRMRTLLERRPVPEMKLPTAARQAVARPRRVVARVPRVPEPAPPAVPVEPAADEALPFNLL